MHYELLAGIRYFKFDDNFSFATDYTSDAFGDDPVNEMDYVVDTENYLLGFQVGGRMDYYLWGGLSVNAGTALGINNAAGVTIESLDLSYTGGTFTGYGLQANNTAGLTVRNCTATGNSAGGGGGGADQVDAVVLGGPAFQGREGVDVEDPAGLQRGLAAFDGLQVIE